MKFDRFLKKGVLETIRDFTSLGNPFLLIVISAAIVGLKKNLLLIILGLVLIEIVCDGIKYFYHKKRPREEKYSNALEKINAGSFPSLHSARSAFVFIMLSVLTMDYYSKLILLGLPLIVGLTRILLKKHYLSDVIIGYVIGIVASIIWSRFI